MTGDEINVSTLPVRMADGAGIVASVYSPPVASATIVCLPALGVIATYYTTLGEALAGAGFNVVTADLRGLGTSTVRPRRGVDFGYATLVEDTGTLVRAVRQRWEAPVIVLGHSLGGHVAALLAGTQPAAIDGLVLCACGTPYWRRFPAGAGAGVYVLAQLTRVLGPVFGYFPGHRVGFAGREAAQLMREWSGLARTGRLAAAGLDAESAFSAGALPVLAISIEGDWMAPRSAVDHLAGKLTSAPVTRLHLTGADMDARALDHFRWAKVPDDVVRVIAGWLRGPALARWDGIATG